ncbi:DNA-processing protein DprA [Alteromonas sp. ASW11-36]|uniref:DNA-processing protein DprA n=1 Tax=Alteromonas arenosi TaxID=3055817 RepID=A0ABT7ST64_9ALTE|nr:DNA-processing protein DprA [Alteromonas sp. ASW11-36]MDM7859365.1 DNA-processing protein DprA [Alteromonas sp. ASW11-36]
MANTFQWVDSKTRRLYLRLNALSGFGSKAYQRLLNNLAGPLEELTEASDWQLRKLGFSVEQVKQWRDSLNCPKIATGTQWHNPQQQRFVITLADQQYPAALKQLSRPPFLLFANGNLQALTMPSVAIVGSRKQSATGKCNAYDFAKRLAQYGMSITSGVALGIDAQAHLGCIESGGITIGVLGCGIDVVYPRRNLAVFDKILVSNGLLISEYLPGTPAKPDHFPQRNRIVSGLALGVLVVEAQMRSGSLITAKAALEQNKDVFAIPGNIHHPQASGCHWLIQQGAKLVTCTEDILEEYQQLSLALPQRAKKSQESHLASPPLLDSVDFDVTTIDVIAERSKLPVPQILAELLQYELRGFVAATSGGYVKLRGK